MSEMRQHYDIIVFRDGKLIDRFPKASDIEIDSCITFTYENDSGIDVMVTYPLDKVCVSLEWKGEW